MEEERGERRRKGMREEGVRGGGRGERRRSREEEEGERVRTRCGSKITMQIISEQKSFVKFASWLFKCLFCDH